MVRAGWVHYLIGVVIGCVIAGVGGSYLPSPFALICEIIGGLMALVCVIYLFIAFVGGGPGPGPHP